MKVPALVLLALCGACAASRDDVAVIPHKMAPVERTTATQCGLYTTASTESAMLATIDNGARVTVLDSVNAYFVKAQFTKNGKAMTGYMYRACLGR